MNTKDKIKTANDRNMIIYDVHSNLGVLSSRLISLMVDTFAKNQEYPNYIKNKHITFLIPPRVSLEDTSFFDVCLADIDISEEYKDLGGSPILDKKEIILGIMSGEDINTGKIVVEYLLGAC